MTSAPYRYETLDGTPHRYGESHARDRAYQDAARIVRETGQPVELVDRGRGAFLIVRLSAKRAKWLKVADAAIDQSHRDARAYA